MTNELTTLERLADELPHFATMNRAAVVMTAAGLDHYGPESVTVAGQTIHYINRGDTYEPTLCRIDGRFVATSWGEAYEQAEADHCQENDEIRCGYCSEFAPMDADDWHDVTCDHCGNLVGG